MTSKDVAEFEAWWEAKCRAEFVEAYGPNENFRPAWGGGFEQEARAAWMAARSGGETSVAPAVAISVANVLTHEEDKARRNGTEISVSLGNVEKWPLDALMAFNLVCDRLRVKTAEPSYTEKDVGAIVAAVDAVRAAKAVTPLTLRDFGYAPGNYSCICFCCSEEFIGDKRASQCEGCATMKLARSQVKSTAEGQS